MMAARAAARRAEASRGASSSFAPPASTSPPVRTLASTAVEARARCGTANHRVRHSDLLVARCSREDSSIIDSGSKNAGGSSQANGSSSSPGKGLNKSPKTPQVRVRFRLQYRCHSRQMIAVAGSMSPLGWSFLSIARNPLNWTEGDWWTIELNFPEGARIEYKYVVLEDQNWTKQDDEAAEGLVPLYRPSGDVTEPVTEAIVRKMAIVAWQPGPNLVFTVPSQEEARVGGETFVDEDKVVIPVTENLDLWSV